MPSKGLSTVFAPIQVRTKVLEINNHRISFFFVLNFVDFPFFTIRMDRIRMDPANATTPPSFEGIERNTT